MTYRAPNQMHTHASDDWKTRAPYKVRENFPVRYEGSCHCGRAKYQLSREKPLDSRLCHCRACQTQHAAPFQWAAIFPKDDVHLLNGHHNLEWYDPVTQSNVRRIPCRVRCAHCHTPLMDEGRTMVLLFPMLIQFTSEADRVLFQPTCHMYYKERVLNIPDGLPKWDGMTKYSNLIEDSPLELVKALVPTSELRDAVIGEDHRENT